MLLLVVYTCAYSESDFFKVEISSYNFVTCLLCIRFHDIFLIFRRECANLLVPKEGSHIF